MTQTRGCRGAARRLRTVAVASLLVAVAGCTPTAGESAPVVLAAASLAVPFDELMAGLDVVPEVSHAGSNTLLDQLSGGARADVLATADEATMDRAVADGMVAGPTRFATNTLVLVTPADDPAGITGLDASLAGAKLVVCAPEVPCGRAALALAERNGVELSPVSEEGSVTDVLGKVVSGEADAGLVYATDARAAGDAVRTVDIPGADEVPTEYWIAAVSEGDADRAAKIIDLVTSDRGRDVLASHGFGPA